MTSTRLNPTANGLPHLGHAYLALCNQHIAQSTGGRFILRCEDDQTAWLRLHTLQEMQDFGRGWLRDLTWLGILPDEFVLESSLADEAWRAVHAHWPNAHDTGEFPYAPEVIGETADPFPYTLALTAKVAWLDAYHGINRVIVGDDLRSRFSLYCYCCEVMGLPVPRQTFVPRLVCDNGGQIDSVSKTGGQWKIATLRERGMQPLEVLELLRRACLKDWGGAWSLDNIAAQPMLLGGAL